MASAAQLKALLEAPALEPPSGVTPDFDNPPNRNALAWFVTTFCIVIGTICLLLRLYSRTWKEKKVHKEEVLMLLAYGAYWGTAYAAYSMIYTPGYYVHQWNLRNQDLVRPLYLILIYGCCYSATLPLIKTAILLDWSRIFVQTDRQRSVFWWGCVILSLIQCLWGIACIALLNMQCVPHNAIWEFYLPSKCYKLPPVMLGSASVQVVTDVCMVILPQRIIWKLHATWQRKIGISVIFGVGLVACVAACVRLSHTVDFARQPDSMYLIGRLLFWAWAEMTAGFFILCVPCVPKLLAESRLSNRVKVALGLARSSNATPAASGNDGLVTIGGSGGPSKTNKLSSSQSGRDAENVYYNLGDEDMPMSEYGRSDSQETLNKERGDPVMRGVAR